MSIKRKIPLAIVLLVTLSLIAIQILVYFFSKNIVIGEAESKLSANSEKTALYVDGLVQGEFISNIQSVTASIEQVSATTEEQSAMVEQLKSMIQNIDDLSRVLVQASSVFKI